MKVAAEIIIPEKAPNIRFSITETLEPDLFSKKYLHNMELINSDILPIDNDTAKFDFEPHFKRPEQSAQ